MNGIRGNGDVHRAKLAAVIIGLDVVKRQHVGSTQPIPVDLAQLTTIH